MILPDIPNHSPYLHYAGKSLDWLPMDTEELYNMHLRRRDNPLLEQGWIDRKFTYKFNQHGFRSDEFEDRDSVLYLGCSHTIGIGLPWENTWPYLVSKVLQLKCYNLGIGGGSNDLAFRMAYNYIPMLKPKIVMFLVTYNTRLELLDKKNTHKFFGPGTSPFRNDKFYETWLMNEGNLNANLAKNVLAIEYICKMHNIKFIALDQNEMPTLDKARDLAHRGIRSNLEFAKQILKNNMWYPRRDSNPD